MKFQHRHGLSDTPVHRSWMSMRQRCLNPNDAAYANYGGRGITICGHWDLFENFLADMGFPEQGQEIDRKENDGDYEPGNCRWASVVQQARNRRDTVIVEFNGEKRSLREWAEMLGIKFATLYARIVVKGWSVSDAFTKPISPSALVRDRKHTTFG